MNRFISSLIMSLYAFVVYGFYPLSSYSYGAANPVNNIDPSGMRVEGVTKSDARNVVNDIKTIFRGEEFRDFRQLIALDGKSIKYINEMDLTSAFKGISLTTDMKAMVDIVVNTINSTDLHTIEYKGKGQVLSKVGESVFAHKFPNLYERMNMTMEEVLNANKGFPVAFLNSGGGATTRYKHKHGTHSVVINDYHHQNGRAVTTGHELFGHGRPLMLSPTLDQHIEAVRTENLILRIMGIQYVLTGAEHGTKKLIINPESLPSFR